MHGQKITVMHKAKLTKYEKETRQNFDPSKSFKTKKF